MSGTEGSWAEFWGGDHPIYVSPRHLEAHYTQIATDLRGLLASRGNPLVLDWGCGDALSAPMLAQDGIRVLLYDAVPAVQERLKRRFAGNPAVTVLDDVGYAALPGESVDVVVMNSVAQYLSRDEIGKVLDQFHRLLRRGGEALLGDIIPPDAGMVADVAALLGPGLQHGYFIAGVIGLARTFFSDYRQLRKNLGFACYRADEFIELVASHKFRVERLPRNIGFSQHRMTFRAKPN